LSAGQVVKSYLWWTHERGSVHYDVMVTLILAFIFLTPRFIHYGDQPKPDWPANEIRIAADSSGALVCEVPTAMVSGRPTADALAAAIVPVAGPVSVERWEPMREVGGQVAAWRVWAHRDGEKPAH
jgi:heme A synthase